MNDSRDHSYKHSIGTLLCPVNSGTFNKHGMLIVIEHGIEDGTGIRHNNYTLYGQLSLQTITMRCWVVNRWYFSAIKFFK